jgi:hypothetical protein
MKTLLAILLLLVVGPGTASAECAWVLWELRETPRPANQRLQRWLWGDTERRVERVAAFDGPASCVEFAKVEARAASTFAPDDSRVVAWPRATIYFMLDPKKPAEQQTFEKLFGQPQVMGWTVFGKREEVSYQCWPDTIDPRGPKGK